MKLTLIRGIPGSGKTTWAKKNFQCCILENDQMQIINGEYKWSPSGTKRAVSLVKSIAEHILSSGADVCICNTFTKRKYIEAFEKMAEQYGAKFEVYKCIGNFNNVHNVPLTTLDAMRNGFESWDGEFIVDPTKEMHA